MFGPAVEGPDDDDVPFFEVVGSGWDTHWKSSYGWYRFRYGGFLGLLGLVERKQSILKLIYRSGGSDRMHPKKYWEKQMGSKLPERQKWLEHALQGLAFWIGHRHSYFRAYPMPEGALVAESCNLIQSNLPPEFVLLPECMYGNLVPSHINIEGVSKQSRADLVICDRDAKITGRVGNVADHVRFVIEVKRGSASRREIDKDLARLHSFLDGTQTDARAFLFIVCEGKAHPRFISDGKSILREQDIPNCSGYFRVRRTVKAAASFSGKSKAHYVCLIEVFVKP